MRNAGRNVMTKTTVTTNSMAAVRRLAITELSDVFDLVDTFFFFCVGFGSEQCYTPHCSYTAVSLY